MASTENRPAPNQNRGDTGSVWPVAVGTLLVLAVLPLRSGLVVMQGFLTSPPYWHLSRAAGLLAYLCLWLAAVSGAASRLPLPAWLRPLQMDAHQWGAVWASYVGLFHGAILLWDQYVGFTWLDILVPFAGEYKPGLVGLGSLALYELMVVTLSTYFRTHLSTSAWRWIHAVSYPAYAVALWHGVALGTDTPLTWVRAFYLGTAAALILLIVYRLTQHALRR